MTVWRTDDGGRTFAQPVVAVAHQFVDHPWLAIDQASGTLYLAWVGRRDEGTGAGFTRSTDGGATFDAPRVVATRPGRVGIPVMAAGPNGAVHIAYETLIDEQLDEVRTKTARSAVEGDEDGSSDDAAAPRGLVGADRRADRARQLVRRRHHVRRSARDRAGPERAGAAGATSTSRPDRRSRPSPGAASPSPSSPCGPTPTSWTSCWPTPRAPASPSSPPVRVSNTPDGDPTAFFQPQVVVDETGAINVTAFALTDGRVDVVLWRAAGPGGPFDAGQRITTEAFDPAAGITTTTHRTKHGAWWIGDYQGLATGGGMLHALWNDTRTGNLELFAAAVPIPTNAS